MIGLSSREIAIQGRVMELLETDYNPFTPQNFMAAVAEVDLTQAADCFNAAGNEHLLSAGRSALHQKAGAIIAAAVEDYYAQLALAKAEQDIANASCVRCYDMGCNACCPDDDHN